MIIDGQTYLTVLQVTGYHCAYCGVGLDDKSAEIDLKTPRSLGGDTVIDNLAASCKECAKLKRHKTLEEFRGWIFECITVPLDKAFEVLDKVEHLMDANDLREVERVLIASKVRLKRFTEQRKVVFYFEQQLPISTEDAFADITSEQLN